MSPFSASFRNSFLACAICVAAGPAALHAQTYRTTLPAWQGTIVMDTLRQDTNVKAAPDMVYKAALAVFKELSISVADSSATTGLVGNGKIETMHAFAGAQMSRWFDCGEMGVLPAANSFRMQIAIAAFVNTAADGGTRLGIAAAASGRDPTGSTPGPRACNSTGNLETALAAKIAKKAGA
jgi:hypothetical protein